jgi:hypothetical protein
MYMQERKRSILNIIFNITVFIVVSIMLLYALWITMWLFPPIKEMFIGNGNTSHALTISNPLLASGEIEFLMFVWITMLTVQGKFWPVWGYKQMLQFGCQMVVGWIVGTGLAYWCATAQFDTLQVLWGAREFCTAGFSWLPLAAFALCLLPYHEYIYVLESDDSGEQVIQGAERGTSKEAFWTSHELLQDTARRLDKSGE